jgi:2-phosphosulfolactate phosphatase
MTELEQAGFDARLEWGVQGAVMLAKVCPVVAVVDVLRFTTAVEVAVARGALVLPHRWSDRAAVPPGPFSLSPASLLAVPPETRLQLPSPNGATVALAAAAGAVVLAGCLRNASAVARAARDLGRRAPPSCRGPGRRRRRPPGRRARREPDRAAAA